jgi:hypothetical protein
MSNLHRDVDEANKHTALGFANGVRGDVLVKDENNVQKFEKPPFFPSVINFVDGSLVAPTSAIGDVYGLLDLGINPIHPSWEAGLTGVQYGDIVIKGSVFWDFRRPQEGTQAFNKTNNKNYYFDGSNWNEISGNATHTGEVTGATALTVDKTAITNKTLVALDPLDHILIADASDSDNLKKVLASDFGGANIYNANGTLTANRTVTLSTFTLTFTGNTTTFKGIGATAGTNAIVVQNSASANLLRVQNDGNVVFGTYGGDAPSTLQINTTDSISAVRIYSSNNVVGLAIKSFTASGGEISFRNSSGSERALLRAVGASHFLDSFAVGATSGLGYFSIVAPVNTDPFRADGFSGGVVKIDKSGRFEARGSDNTSSNFCADFTNLAFSSILKLRNDVAIGMYGATPVVQATTSGSASTFVANTSGISDNTATFDGYTIGQIVKALRNIGILQ